MDKYRVEQVEEATYDGSLSVGKACSVSLAPYFMLFGARRLVSC